MSSSSIESNSTISVGDQQVVVEDTTTTTLDETTTTTTDETTQQQPITSSKLSQGEIIFVTILSFVIFLSIILGIYMYIRRKRLKAEAALKEQQRLQDENNKPTFVIDCPNVESQMNSNNSGRQQQQRRGSQSSAGTNSNHGNSSHQHRQQERRQSTRRSSNGSIGSVNSNYKKAAIDHMNQISSTGGY